MKKDLLSLYDLDTKDFDIIWRKAGKLKKYLKAGKVHDSLKGKTLGMIFDKSSTRTRISFEVGMFQLGGIALFLSSRDTQIGRGESIYDTARIMSRYLNGIMIRTYAQEAVEEFARHATIPVINALSDGEHPCQALADAMTLRERFGALEGLKVAYVGDGNNCYLSLAIVCAKLGMHVTCACPEGYDPDMETVAWADGVARERVGSVTVMRRSPLRSCSMRWRAGSRQSSGCALPPQ